LLLREVGGSSSDRARRESSRRRTSRARSMGDTTVLLPQPKKDKTSARGGFRPWAYGLAAFLIAGVVTAMVLRMPGDGSMTPIAVSTAAEEEPESPAHFAALSESLTNE